MQRKKLFIQNGTPAPYRTDVFEELSLKYDIFVAFEKASEANRNQAWFTKDHSYGNVIITDEDGERVYRERIKNIRTYDAVIAYEYSTKKSLKLLVKCILCKIPYFINCDGAFVKKHLIKNLVKRFFIKHAAGLFANGQHAKDYFLHFGAKEKNIYLYNFSSLLKNDILKAPLNEQEKKNLRESLGMDKNKKAVVSVGQFCYRKGFDVLLDAWKSVSENAVLYIVGGGALEYEYLCKIKNENIKNVVIMRYIEKKKLLDIISASDFFTLATREDIWGLVVNEAMACGKPVITTDRCIAGLELIKDNVNGYIVKSEDSNGLAVAMKKLLYSDRLTEMGIKSLEKIQNYTVENVAKSHMAAIDIKLK